MAFKYILILIIIVVISLLFQVQRDWITEGNISGVVVNTVTNTDTKEISQPNMQINTDPAKWININEATPIASSLGYTINDLNTHINLMVNNVGCAFFWQDEHTTNWIRYSGTKMRWAPRQQCYYNNYGRRRNQNCYTIYTPIIEKISYTIPRNLPIKTTFKIDIDDYKTIMSQIVTVYDIKNDNGLAKMTTFSKLEGFQSILEPLEPMDDKQVDKDSVVSDKRGNPLLNENAVNAVVQSNYNISQSDFSNLLKTVLSEGGTNADITSYISAMQTFGITGETEATLLKNTLKTNLNTSATIKTLPTLITSYFPNYGITNVADIVDLNSGALGPFTNAVTRFNLQQLSLPLFPNSTTNTNNANNCVMEKLKDIHGNIPTIGKNDQNNYYINGFFDAFSSHGIDPAKFFGEIYPLYKELSINNSIKPIQYTLYYVKSFGNQDMTTAFKNMKLILTGVPFSSLNDYVSYADMLTMKLTTNASSLDATILVQIWKDFVKYYNDIAYSDKNTTLDNPVTITTLNNVLTDIENEYSTNSPNIKNSPKYFNVGINTFKDFFATLYQKKYTISALKRDISLGSDCKNLISTGANKQTEKFTSFNDLSNDDGFLSQIKKWISRLFYGDKEEMTGSISMSDSSLLSSFGISDFDKEWGKLEQILMQLNVNNLNKNATTMQNMMQFIQVMVETGITYKDMDTLLDIMNTFGAKDIINWKKTLNTLKKINIKGVENIKAYLKKITEFGVTFGYKFNQFNNVMNKFGADFSSGTGAIGTFNAFIDDMIRFRFTYHTPVKINTTNTVIAFLIKSGIKLNTYASNRVQIAGCKSLNVERFPSLFMNSLYNYSNTSGTSYPNKMRDVQTTTYIDQMESCYILEIMQQAYMVMNKLDEFNGNRAILRPNIINIIPFFYKEEVDEIKKSSDYYSSFDNRIAMMHGVSNGIATYSETLRKNDPISADNYVTISAVITVFPLLAFQYFSDEILSSCTDGTCKFDIYVDPKNTTCKASTTDQTINYRSEAPVIPKL